MVRFWLPRIASGEQSYQILPITVSGINEAPSSSDPEKHLYVYQSPINWIRRPSKRFISSLALGFIFIQVWRHLWVIQGAYQDWRENFHGLPTYRSIKLFEKSLPQHNPGLPFPEGTNGRYVKFNVPYHRIGWNNQLQDMIMMAHLSYLAKRGPAFQPFLWDLHTNTAVVEYKGHYRSASIPLNALLSGPIAGGDIGDSTVPRAISYEYYDRICPKERRTLVDVKEVRKQYKIEAQNNPKGVDILNAWVDKLSNMTEPCVLVDGDHVFTFFDYGPKVLSTWDSLSHSPVISNFSWSPLVRSIIADNYQLLSGETLVLHQTIPKQVPGLLAVHLRRGDFVAHCDFLTEWQIGYATWNNFPDYQDHFKVPNNGVLESNRKEMYRPRCLPTVDQVVQRVREVKAEWEAAGKGRKLERIFILTNAEEEFRHELMRKLWEDHWESVSTSSELVVQREAIEVDVLADMMIGEIAEVFLGNGFSTLTANVNLVRRARNVSSQSIRFF